MVNLYELKARFPSCGIYAAARCGVEPGGSAEHTIYSATSESFPRNQSEQVDEPLPSESNEGATSGAVSGNSSTSKRKVKRAFSKVGESSFELEGVQPKIKKVSNKQEIVTLLKKSADD
ncbi:hypothetical protein J6590_099646 [Homalodisca vitripennis]|nr:hypothetical protein J6590_099646 [Homalodisca vitripennis]